MSAGSSSSDIAEGLGPTGRPFSIVPADTGGGALIAVVAVLAFLATLAIGTAAMVTTGAAAWRSALTGEATVQLRPLAGRDERSDVERIVALARATAGIRSAEALSRADAERLLEPWLGSGLDLSELPVPRLVILRLDPETRPDLLRLAARLKADVPGASLDDHSAWLARLSDVTTGVLLAALTVVLLVLAASAGAIAFATRAVVAGHRDIVEVLHFVGADSRFVALLFARRFARLGLTGGAIGAVGAALVLFVAGRFLVGGDAAGAPAVASQAFAMGPVAYFAMACVALADGAVAGLVTAATVQRFLKDAS